MNIEKLNGLDKIDPVIKYVCSVSDHPRDSLKDEIISAIRHKDDFVLLANDGDICGVFVFFSERTDKYLELLHAFSENKYAYDAVFSYLSAHFGGSRLDVIIKSGNELLEQKLETLNAIFYPPQIKTVLNSFTEYKNDLEIVPFDERYRDGYIAIHSDDAYWTGEKVLSNLNIFKVFLALERGEVVGYIDVTYGFEEVEPYDLFVRSDCRNKGYGKALLSKAVKEIMPDKMTALIDAADACAIRVFDAVGFDLTPEQNQTVTVML